MSRFEVVLPVLNSAKTLASTLQTLTELPNDDVSFLVSNNHSSDTSPAIIGDFASRDKRFRVVHTDRVLPLKDSLEFAFGHAEGDYLMIIGGDDGLYTGCIEVAQEALRQHPDAQALAHRRSFLTWPDLPDALCSPAFPPGAFRMSAVNTFELRSATSDLRNQALGLIHAPMPAPYMGWVSMDIVRRIRARVGRVFAHGVTDFWFAASLGAELNQAKYVLTGLPLSIGAYSKDSSALSIFNKVTSPVADQKLSLETNVENEMLMFLTKSARGYRYEVLKLVLKHWPEAPYTEREVDLNYLCGFWEEWKLRTSTGKDEAHGFTGGAAALRAVVDKICADAGLQELIADLDRNYVLEGDNSALWKKWGTTFQQDHDWSHELCIDTRSLGCRNVHDVARLMPGIVNAVMQAGEGFARILSGRRLSGGPPANPARPLATAGWVAVREAHDEQLRKALRPLQKESAAKTSRLRRFDKYWRVDDAPWALRTGLRIARFLGKATGSFPK